MNKTTHQYQAEKWVLQICERAYVRREKHFEVWKTISLPMPKPAAMTRLRRLQTHPKPHRLLTSIHGQLVLGSILKEVLA